MASDPLNNLIKRAQVFRQTLLEASTKNTGVYSNPSSVVKQDNHRRHHHVHLPSQTAASVLYDFFNQELENETETETVRFPVEEEDHDRDSDSVTDFEEDNPNDVAEEALLQELFFPAQEEEEVKLLPLTSFNTKKPEPPIDKSSICLSVDVGKLLFCQSRSYFNNILDACSNTSSKSSASCFLTLTFPAIMTGNDNEVGRPAEQCISIMAVKVNRKEADFDHHSQLFWKLPLGQTLDSIWNQQQMMKATVEFTRHDGTTEHGSAYLSLQNVVKSRLSTLKSNLVMMSLDQDPVSCSTDVTNNHSQEQKFKGKNQCKIKVKESSLKPKWNGQKPLATIELGLTLLHSLDKDCTKSLTPELKDSWIYVHLYVDNLLSKMETMNGRTRSLMLAAKSGNNSAIRFVPLNPKPRSIMLTKNVADVSLEAPNCRKGGIVFVEIWCNHNGSTNRRNDGLENLYGLLKLSIPEKIHEDTYGKVVDGTFPLWHPRNDAQKESIRAIIYMGSKADMISVLTETRSAITIQRHVRQFLQKLHRARTRRRRSTENNDTQGETLKHIFEVTVQRAMGIPTDALLENENGFQFRGMFIKYIFPGEDEPLYTHDVELQKTVVFGATAHHRITLGQGQRLLDYLEDLDEETSGLRFELWSDVLDVGNKANENYLTSTAKRKERCIGAATLPIKELTGLLKLSFENRFSVKIRRLFDLPIKFQMWMNCHQQGSKLTVQVAYDRINLSEKHLLDGTVFYNYNNTAIEPHFPMKATLLISVLEVKHTQGVLDDVALFGGESYSMRISLFPCNRELEHTYPPVMKRFSEDSDCVSYTLDMDLDATVVKELWESFMSFEVWKHVTVVQDDAEVVQKDSRLGVAIAPCVMLISGKQGISGWIDLVGSGRESVGSLKISTKFLNWES